jgi:hypothetical protein
MMRWCFKNLLLIRCESAISALASVLSFRMHIELIQQIDAGSSLSMLCGNAYVVLRFAGILMLLQSLIAGRWHGVTRILPLLQTVTPCRARTV